MFLSLMLRQNMGTLRSASDQHQGSMYVYLLDCIGFLAHRVRLQMVLVRTLYNLS